jgi:hypothetical protein
MQQFGKIFVLLYNGLANLRNIFQIQRMKVKNKFWMIVCFLMFFSSVRAEKTGESRQQCHLHFMLFAGFNSSRLVTDFKNKDIITSEARQHFNFGAAFRLELGTTLYLQPEVYLTRKGGLEKTFRQDSLINVLTLDVPVMLGLRFFDNNKFAVRLCAGPVLSFLRNHEIGVYENGAMIYSSINTKPTVFSMQVGAGLDITRRFTFDMRYEYAFSPMFTVADFRTAYRIFYFTVGVKLF